MSGYQTHVRTLRLGDHDYRARSLSDPQQFADADNTAQRIGISSAQWSLFGHVWPSGRLLADSMALHDIEGKRILEIGCAAALASLVRMRRGADIVASDHDALGDASLACYAALNEVPAVAFRTLSGDVEHVSLGAFDLLIASDIFHERGHAELLADVMRRHASPIAEILITDPGRGNSASLTRALALQGFLVSEQRGRMNAADVVPFRGRLPSCRRGVVKMVGTFQ